MLPDGYDLLCILHADADIKDVGRDALLLEEVDNDAAVDATRNQCCNGHN